MALIRPIQSIFSCASACPPILTTYILKRRKYFIAAVLLTTITGAMYSAALTHEAVSELWDIIFLAFAFGICLFFNLFLS